MARFRCGSKCARILAMVVGVGAIAGVALSVAEITSTHEGLRSFVWPLSVAGASLWFAFAALVFAGAVLHPAPWLVVVATGTVQVLGDYESESFYLPTLAAGVVALFIAYRWSGARLGTLSRPRQALLALALLSALLGIGQMQVPTDRLSWDRVRTAEGSELRTFVSEPPCPPPSAGDVALIDQGCDAVIPARRAWFVIGYATAAMLLGAVAVAGSRVNPGELSGHSL